jgi:hypothetical protein
MANGEVSHAPVTVLNTQILAAGVSVASNVLEKGPGSATSDGKK